MLAVLVVVALSLALYRWVDPPVTVYIWAEARRLDGIAREPVPMADIAPVMARAAVVAASSKGVAQSSALVAMSLNFLRNSVLAKPTITPKTKADR